MKKHTHYDSTEMRALKNSAIPAAIMASPGTRFDSAEDASMFFARELDHVKAQSYDVQYPEFTALNLFPISSEADPGAETITYYTYDKTGLAKIIDNYSTDLPRADVNGKPSYATIKSIGDSYGYSAQEMRASRLAGKSLDVRKAEAARYSIDHLTNKIAWAGDEESGLMGVLSDGQNIPLYTIGTGAESTILVVPQRDLHIRIGTQQILGVGVDGHEFHVLQAFGDHAIDGVAAGSTDTDDLDVGLVVEFSLGDLAHHSLLSLTVTHNSIAVGLTINADSQACTAF